MLKKRCEDASHSTALRAKSCAERIWFRGALGVRTAASVTVFLIVAMVCKSPTGSKMEGEVLRAPESREIGPPIAIHSFSSR